MRVAMYLRLSSEDGDLKDTGKAESESISNQRGLLQNFISSRSEFSGWEISEFCDDGWSGKNFERPDFLRMMEQVKQGQIHCIVVKDDCVNIGLNSEGLEKAGFCEVRPVF